MKATTIIGIGLVGFALLALLTIVLAGGWIQDDLAERSQGELEAEGQSWAAVAMNGRDAVLSGTAADADSAKKAMDAVARVWGVRAVQDETATP
jgi:osmotically-inducible protein OsmY